MRTRVLLCAALLVMTSGCATTTPEPTQSAVQLQSLGEKSLAAGETVDALKYLTEAQQKKPNDVIIEYDLALAYDQRGLQDKALSHFQSALKKKPDFPEALNAVGYIYATRGQFELAQGAFQKALDNPFYKTPQFAAYNLGMLYEKKGEIETALSYYEQAVKLDQNYGMAWFRLGQALEQSHRDDEARHAYGNAVRASHDLAEAHLRFGILSYLAGDLGPAVHSLSEVGKIAPNTDMADEARRYLEKLNSAEQRNTQPHSSPHISPAIPSEGLWNTKVEEEHPASEEIESSTGAHPAHSSGWEASTDSAKGLSDNPDSQSHGYTVQLGSFLDRQNAEDIKKRLQEKGFRAVVKSRKDHVLGKVFVIQLQPVNSIAEANTLMTQLGGEIEGEPVIIKLPSQ